MKLFSIGKLCFTLSSQILDRASAIIDAMIPPSTLDTFVPSRPLYKFTASRMPLSINCRDQIGHQDN
jgi:hypothetical protein